MNVRLATIGDAAACAAIYAPYVRETIISFETTPPDEAEMAARIEHALERHAWFVAERDGRVVGYAYGGPFNPRPAYRWACEVSVYVDRDARGGGVGRALYGALLPHLVQRGYQRAAAGMSLPNPASAAFHAAQGFEPMGTWKRIGFKFGAWHDVGWTQRSLAEDESPAEPC
jgi:L-amino acid N-acyltransferase YncA